MLGDPKQIERDSKLPLYFQLEQIIKQAIVSGDLKPDEIIPAENELIDRFNLSRTTVRQALSDLAADNLIYKVKGVGTFVSKPKISMQYMGSLVSFNEQISALGMKPATKVLKMETSYASDHINELLELKEDKRVIELIRVRYANGEPIVIVHSWHPYDLCADILNKDLEENSLYDLLSNNPETKVHSVERTIEATIVSADDRKLLNVKVGFPIQKFINKAYNMNGRVLEYSSSRYRGDRNKFYVKLIH